MNKKAVEGLPLRYLIIALSAALVIGIVMETTGILRSGITGAVINLNKTLANATALL